MNQFNFVNRLSINYVIISLFIQFLSCNQEELVQPEENLASFKEEDANYLLNSVNKNLRNQEISDDLLMSSFDSSIHYKIDWNKRPDDFLLNNANDSIVTLITKDSSQYHCVLPEIESQEQSQKEDANIDAYAKIEHLFKKKTCIYKLDSFWTYEICLNDFVRQFNGDILAKKHTQEYYLGHFKETNLERDRQEYNKKAAELRSKNKNLPKIDFDGIKVPYIYLTMDKGTICDLTEQPRLTRIYFVCDKNDKKLQLESIEEIKSCEYEAIISTNLLCDHPDFREKKKNEFQINCFPENNDEQSVKPIGIDQYELKKLDLSDSIMQQIQEMMSSSKFKIELEPLNHKAANTKIKSIGRTNFMDSVGNQELSVDSFIYAKKCYVSTFKSYWKYSFCFKKSIEMFHEEAGVRTQSILLGKFDEDKHLDWLDANPSKRKSVNEINYLYSDGDICHESNRLRYVEVKLKCPIDPKHFSMSLEEQRLCEYKLTLESNLICKLIDLVDENGV